MPPGSNSAELLPFLLACLPNDPQEFSRRLTAVHDWSRLLRHAERHGVLGVLHAPLLAGDRVPAEIREQLAQRRALEQLWENHLRETLEPVVAALHDNGVQTVVLKGPVLGERLYDDSSLRRSTDLDLLVAPRDFDAALTVLARFEYQVETGASARYHQRFHHHWCLAHPRRPPIELHFRAYVGFGAHIAAAGFMERARPYRTQRGSPCFILCPEDECLYLCLHAAGHDFAR